MKAFIFRIAALAALGTVDYLLDRPWRLLVFFVIVIYLLQWTAFQHRREAIHIVRQRRHRQANQLQLVAGWLQLGAVGKAEDALKALLDVEAAQAEWLRGFPSRWSYLFLTWDARAEEQGVILVWQKVQAVVPGYRMAWMLEWRLSQAMHIPASRVLVEFRGQAFRILAEIKGSYRVPRGWRPAPEGIECAWGRKRRSVRPGHSAQI